VADLYCRIAKQELHLPAFLDLSTSMTLNDLEPSKKVVLVIFFTFFGCSTYFNGKLQRNGWK